MYDKCEEERYHKVTSNRNGNYYNSHHQKNLYQRRNPYQEYVVYLDTGMEFDNIKYDKFTNKTLITINERYSTITSPSEINLNYLV